MDKNFGDTWTEVDDLIAEVVEIYKTSLRDVSKLKAAAAEGAAARVAAAEGAPLAAGRQGHARPDRLTWTPGTPAWRAAACGPVFACC